jgi:hypothetical protein
MAFAMIIPLVAYIYIAYYGFLGSRSSPERLSASGRPRLSRYAGKADISDLADPS